VTKPELFSPKEEATAAIPVLKQECQLKVAVHETSNELKTKAETSPDPDEKQAKKSSISDALYDLCRRNSRDILHFSHKERSI
jgi:hypothetical protein